MGQWIDDLARAMARGVSRRDALRRIGGGLSGLILVALLPARAEAGKQSNNTATEKVVICHKTGSKKNPCVKIRVSQSAVPAHQAHGDAINPNFQTDPNNCGKCCKKCDPGQVCQGGVCAGNCSEGLTRCNGSCVNLQTDSSNCGSCGNACTTGRTCQSGQCVCTGSLTSCNGSCVNLQTDSNNCGSCGNACTGGKTCQSGQCVCGSGLTDCSGTCVNLQTDEDHCGSCGNSCAATETCQSGSCVCSPGTCGSFTTGCNSNGSCFCFKSTENTGACTCNFSCDDPSGCDSSSDCSSGQVCVKETCCGSKKYCRPVCTPSTVCSLGALVSGARTAARK